MSNPLFVPQIILNNFMPLQQSLNVVNTLINNAAKNNDKKTCFAKDETVIS